jgi:amino acid permease
VGSCVAYLIYTVAALSDVLSGIPCVEVSRWAVTAGVAPLLAALSLLPSPKYLAPTSTLGNVAIVLVRPPRPSTSRPPPR